MNFIRNILFIQVGFILLLHVAIPHKHHSEMSYEEHKNSHEYTRNFIDLISLALHQDVTKNSENFILEKRENQKNIEIENLLFFNNFNFSVQNIKINTPKLDLSYFPQKLFKKPHAYFKGLRGPPKNDYYL